MCQYPPLASFSKYFQGDRWEEKWKKIFAHRPFVPLGFEKIRILCIPSISLACKPTHKARAGSRDTLNRTPTDTPCSGPYHHLHWWLEGSPVTQRPFPSSPVDWGPPCPHWTLSYGHKKAGWKFQRGRAKGRTL